MCFKYTEGKVKPEVGGHEIIIRGQIPDYVSNIGRTFELPVGVAQGTILGGYSVPIEQAENVAKALKNSGINKYKKIEINGSSATFIFNRIKYKGA